MLPLFLDLSRLRLALIGNGDGALRRLHLLEEAGATEIAVFAAAPSSALAAAAGARLQPRWPEAADLASVRLVFIADPPAARKTSLVARARAAGTLVHVEDAPSLSDAQAAAVLRRGALTLAVATGGASPALAQRIRDFLGGVFGPEWQERLDDIAWRRRAWREAGLAPDRIAGLTREWMRRGGWKAMPSPRRTARRLGP